MVVTGAGPGIMAAAMEGAGREHSLGVSIRLPFEQQANPIIAADGKLVSMKYFFTRKLMLVKESKAFVCLPGGFGTLDETFELLTLTQTGKGVPVPIVFLDIPGGTYWERCREFIQAELVSRALVTPDDLNLFLVTDDVERARAEICGFYVNYDSMRFVGDHLVIRLQARPDRAAAGRPRAALRRPGGARRDRGHRALPRGGGRRRLPRPPPHHAGLRQAAHRRAPHPHRRPQRPGSGQHLAGRAPSVRAPSVSA